MRTHPASTLALLLSILIGACVNKESKSSPTAPPDASSPQPTGSVTLLARATSASATASANPAAPQTAPERIAAQHLLVAYKGAAAAPKTATRTKEQARKRAEDAARRAKAGEDFSALVAEYSDDPTVKNRGNLGVFNRESKVKPFADAAFALPVNGVSDVVETQFGFHVIKRNQ